MTIISAPNYGLAETVFASRTIRSHTVLSEGDVTLKAIDTSGAAREVASVVGLEARRVLYKGRPILLADIGPAAVIERNQVVTLVFSRGSLTISVDARSLDRAAVGEPLRVMNLSSRKTVSGVVTQNGSVTVGLLDQHMQN